MGKTTCAVATALMRAARGERVWLLSTDPAHSLSDVVQEERPDTLVVEELDADAATEAFRSAHRDTLHEIVSLGTLFAESDVAALLDLSLPGMDEIMAFLRLSELLGPGNSSFAAGQDASVPTGDVSTRNLPDRNVDVSVDVVVVDTAPTGHTLRLLDAPGRFLQWLDVLDALLEKHRYMRSVFGGGGADRYDAFLDRMRDRAARVESALSDEDGTQFVVVTRAEPVVDDETRRLVRHLQRRGVSVPEIVVNAFPAGGADEAGESEAQTEPSPEEDDAFDGEADLWAVPDRSEALETQTPGALRAFWKSARRIDAVRLQHAMRRSSGSGVPVVEDPAPLPASRLLLVAGKGGVGKTTIAAATALRLASEGQRRDQRVLVASTDPAHSLFDVLGADGAEADGVVVEETQDPAEIAPGLDAVEIDAQERFDQLREAYASEVRQFFAGAGGSNLDLPYDRPVAESLVDLAPPGIDEVMGWLAVMEFLEGDTYHTCVVDTAPTGHFVRLLDMPDLFAEWIRALFRILRNHRDVLRLPDLNDRLVRLSKQIRRWNGLLDDGTASVVSVTLPRQVVAAETRDLQNALRDRKTAMPVLVANRVTPPGDRSSGEAAVIEAYRAALPDAAVPLVHDGTSPRTQSALQSLGNRLYHS